MDNIKNVLPVGWERIDFGKSFQKVTYTKKINKKDFLVDGKIPIISQEKLFINGYWNNGEDIFKVDTPVVIFGDHTKIFKYINFDFVLGADGVKILLPISKIDSKYYFYHLKSLDLATLGYARHFRVLKEHAILFPTNIEEQKRIVQVLDEVFENIDAAQKTAEENLVKAKQVFESYLQNVFEEKGEDWEEKKLEKITTKIGSGATPRGGKANYKQEGISLIRSMNVHDFQFKEKNLAFIDQEQANGLSNVVVEEGDVLLNITGASIARCCMIPKHILPGRVNQHVSIIRAEQLTINPIFLGSLLTSKYFKNKILKIGEQGATRQAITKAQLEKFIVSFPKSLEKQKEIVNILDELSGEVEKLENIYREKSEKLEELRKSVLQEAFRGNL